MSNLAASLQHHFGGRALRAVTTNKLPSSRNGPKSASLESMGSHACSNGFTRGRANRSTQLSGPE